MHLMAEITSDELLDLAHFRLCRRRERTSHNNDVWDVRWRWANIVAVPKTARAPRFHATILLVEQEQLAQIHRTPHGFLD